MALIRFSFLFFTYAVIGSWTTRDVPAPRYVIDLDVAPQDRWNDVVRDYKQYYQALLKDIKKIVPPEVVALASLIGRDVEKYIPYPYNLEIVGVALTGDVDIGDVVLGNSVYEVTAYNSSKLVEKACTSIVAEAVNGTIYHGRNLDYSISQMLRNLTIVVEFQSKGKTVYTGTKPNTALPN